MQEKCIQSSKAFIDYIGWIYCESEKQLVINNVLIITEMEEAIDLKTEDDFKKLYFKARRMWERQADSWFKVSGAVKKNLSRAYSVLWSLCHSGLQQKIKSDKDYEAMTEGDVGELYRIIQKICHGNSSTENPFTNLIESWYNFLMIKGDSYDALDQYYEAFEKQYEVVEKAGGFVNTPEFRDLYMAELESREMTTSDIYMKLKAWKAEESWISIN